MIMIAKNVVIILYNATKESNMYGVLRAPSKEILPHWVS